MSIVVLLMSCSYKLMGSLRVREFDKWTYVLISNPFILGLIFYGNVFALLSEILD